jgi:uncharacterized protein YecE (DUF72 family)
VYSEVFNFVELNYTFYDYPNIRLVEGWRKKVTKDFTFSVRCQQDLTHKIGLKPVDEAYQVLGQMVTYCRILEAPFLVLETPVGNVFDTTQKRMKSGIIKNYAGNFCDNYTE